MAFKFRFSCQFLTPEQACLLVVGYITSTIDMPPIPFPIKEWVRGAEIGKGKFATVYIGINKENMKLFAVKSIDKNDKEKRFALENERKALTGCNSKYVVQYLGCASTKRKDSNTTLLDLFIELVPKGSVLDQLDRNEGGLNERLVAAYTRDVLHGLKHIHELGIVHGDIKCANFLVGSQNIKLCDFGSAKFSSKDYLISPKSPGNSTPKRRRIFVTGTVGYMAPEVVDQAEQDTPSDIFSLGCSIVEMCTGNPPENPPAIYAFEGHDAIERDEDEDFAFSHCTVDIPPTYSSHCREFVDWCFALDPDDRPSADALLGHSWIVNAPPFPKRVETLSPRAKSTFSFSNLLGCGP